MKDTFLEIIICVFHINFILLHTILYGMQKYINMKKVEKKQWFIIGLQIIENEGVSKITIDNLCALLKITKGAFYHHSKI